jgi:kynurenine formamidase
MRPWAELAGVIGATARVEVVDLSATIVPSPPEVPAWQRTDLVYNDHRAGAQEMEELFGVPARLMRDGEGPATEYFTRFVTHNTTHVDAPWHYNSRIEGRPSRSIDEVPLDWFVAPGVVLDVGGRADGDTVEVADLERELDRSGITLRGGEVVLLRTGCDAYYGQPDYATHGPGVSAAATVWLCDQGIRVVGIDAWGWDPPVGPQAAAAIERDEPGVFWAAHQVDREFAQIERLVNLGGLPAQGFLVVALPLKVERGSAGPTRAVAIVPVDDPATAHDHETIDMTEVTGLDSSQA